MARARARTDATLDHRNRELRKIADCLLALADEVESEERNRELLHPRRAMKAHREIRCSRVACGLLMDTLAFDGPVDGQLRLILLSWRDKPDAAWRCFDHVCDVWKPLRDSRIGSSTAKLLECATALRMIAIGVAGPPT